MSTFDVVHVLQQGSQMLSHIEFWKLLRQELLPLRPSQYDICATVILAEPSLR